jgi:hypothetical protein
LSSTETEVNGSNDNDQTTSRGRLTGAPKLFIERHDLFSQKLLTRDVSEYRLLVHEDLLLGGPTGADGLTAQETAGELTNKILSP